MSCREMGCLVDRVERNWTTCYGQGDCSAIDDLYSDKDAGICKLFVMMLGTVAKITPGASVSSVLYYMYMF